MPATDGSERKQAVNKMKRELILKAGRSVFEASGLEGASLRAIAKAAGYTPAALYFHFTNKEEIYAALLEQSLINLQDSVDEAVIGVTDAKQRLRAVTLAFFHFYLHSPKDLELGFYLSQGGMTPKGVGQEYNSKLNDRLVGALSPIALAAQELGASQSEARQQMAAIFAHATGVLLLAHTGRIRLFELSADAMMDQYLDELLSAYR